MQAQTNVRVTLALLIVLVAALGWLVLAHPFGHGSLVQRDACTWALTDAGGHTMLLSSCGRNPTAT